MSSSNSSWTSSSFMSLSRIPRSASGRPGRYEAYTLDFALFMGPRLRGIEHVEFWKIDEQRRRKGLREAPRYPLDRARMAAAAHSEPDSDRVLDEIDLSVGTEPEDGQESGPSTLFS